jgi:hypothetical protein
MELVTVSSILLIPKSSKLFDQQTILVIMKLLKIETGLDLHGT